MKKAALLILAAVMISCLAQAAPAADKSLLVLGSAPQGDNPSAARQAAVDAALREAVGQVAISMMDPATLRQNLERLSKEILAKAPQLITSYTMESHAQDGDKVLVLVSATVSTQAVHQALTATGLRLVAAHLGKVMILVADDYAPGRPPAFWWGGGADGPPPLLAKVAGRLGIIQTNTAQALSSLPPEMRQAQLTTEQALDMARHAGADLVITGQVRSYPQVTPAGETPPPAARLTALWVASGAPLGAVEEPGPVFHQSPGPEAAGEVAAAVEKAARDVLAQAAAGAPNKEAVEREMTLVVRGVSSLARLHKFNQVLSSLGSLFKDLSRQSTGGGEAVYTFKTPAEPSRLADELMVQDYGTFLVNVVETGQDRIELMLISR